MDIQTKNEYFHYLNELLDADDEINMYGAEPFLMRDFHMSNREASKVVQLWKNSFKEKKMMINENKVRIDDWEKFTEECEISDFPNVVFDLTNLGFGDEQTTLVYQGKLYYCPTKYLISDLSHFRVNPK
jgi:hypothetical protein